MLTVNTAAGHRGPALVGHGVLKASGGERGEGEEQGGRKWKVELGEEKRGLFYFKIVVRGCVLFLALSTCIKDKQ